MAGGHSFAISTRSGADSGGSWFGTFNDWWSGKDARDYRFLVADIASEYGVDSIVLYSILRWEYNRDLGLDFCRACTGAAFDIVTALPGVGQKSFGATNVSPSIMDYLMEHEAASLAELGFVGPGSDAPTLWLSPLEWNLMVVDADVEASLAVTALFLRNRADVVTGDPDEGAWLAAAAAFGAGNGPLWEAAAGGSGGFTSAHVGYMANISGQSGAAWEAMCTSGLVCGPRR